MYKNWLIEQIDDQNINRNSRNRRRINQPLNNIINSNGQLNFELNASRSAEQSITYSGNLNSAEQTGADLNNQLIGDMILTQNVENEQTDFTANTVMEQANVETPIQSELPRQTNSDEKTLGINNESSDEILLDLSRLIFQMSFDERILTLISENVNDIKTTITSYNSDALKNQKESLDSHKEYIQIQNELLNGQKEVNSMACRRFESFNDLNSTANMSMLFSNSGNQSSPSLPGIQNTSIELNNSENITQPQIINYEESNNAQSLIQSQLLVMNSPLINSSVTRLNLFQVTSTVHSSRYSSRNSSDSVINIDHNSINNSRNVSAEENIEKRNEPLNNVEEFVLEFNRLLGKYIEKQFQHLNYKKLKENPLTKPIILIIEFTLKRRTVGGEEEYYYYQKIAQTRRRSSKKKRVFESLMFQIGYVPVYNLTFTPKVDVNTSLVADEPVLSNSDKNLRFFSKMNFTVMAVNETINMVNNCSNDSNYTVLNQNKTSLEWIEVNFLIWYQHVKFFLEEFHVDVLAAMVVILIMLLFRKKGGMTVKCYVCLYCESMIRYSEE
ncbi:unnamed protein product [Brachionus calyciflorus]|uniref:Uncharacterized protein n=1 Tax=Brachionus calyciflorus TaxID=104777 RepID=A0A814HRE1_9BILA|nr:unnamed protein product [Brachionus calyciflorus]